MKKTFFLISMLFITVACFSQTQNLESLRIQTQIDSLIKAYDIHTIDIHSPYLTNVKSTISFNLENGFLVVNKMEYYNLDRLLSFEIFMNFLTKKYTLVIYLD